MPSNLGSCPMDLLFGLHRIIHVDAICEATKRMKSLIALFTSITMKSAIFLSYFTLLFYLVNFPLTEREVCSCACMKTVPAGDNKLCSVFNNFLIHISLVKLCTYAGTAACPFEHILLWKYLWPVSAAIITYGTHRNSQHVLQPAEKG